MIDLGLSILCSSLIFVIFKLYPRFRVQTLYAIIFNYITACLVGLTLIENGTDLTQVIGKSWFPGTVLMGVLFIVIFNLMARTSQTLGVSVASVATKMSLAIPVVLGVFLYGEELGLLKVVGVLLALFAVYFTSVKNAHLPLNRKLIYLPALVFLGSGIIDASIQYFEQNVLSAGEFPLFSSMVFASAACCGLIFVSLRAIREKVHIDARSILGGIALGVPNFFSIYFLLRALQNEVLNSASVFTVNNVAIVMFSTLLGIVLFREKLSGKNWFGIALAILSILLVAAF
ncbi:EamA-like transporter family protein [Muriicola jejuensis]|uniref:EamA family transporter n=1 Tax=Muriicola jejuensis TaxID=504488 RepID=A0A6P0UCN7_9FLAO|nr:EamA family transporter [Muriicola jejuensis]NER11051.1 EamA family transporter [Muriicola jejuensis]SMP23209.1 EamA-like transporter family protein [Muriicola jejuensis]